MIEKDKKLPRTVYVVTWRYGPNLAQATLVKETPKTYNLTDVKHLMGWNYLTGRTLKRKVDVYDDLEMALMVLVAGAKDKLTTCQYNVEQAQNALDDLLGKLEKERRGEPWL